MITSFHLTFSFLASINSLMMLKCFRNIMEKRIPYHSMSKLRFSAYSSSEITKLSVVEVINPETVNILGHPSKGGLHDPALGNIINRYVFLTCHCKINESDDKYFLKHFRSEFK